MTRTSLSIAGAVLVAASFMSTPAVDAADNKARDAKPAAAKPAPLLLSPAQLRECLAQQQSLRGRADASER